MFQIFIKYSYILLLNILINPSEGLSSKSWDKDCMQKWPSCTFEDVLTINTACARRSCGPRFKTCFELPADSEFRQAVLDRHNELRNKVASGEETRSGLVKAANMMAFSYDMSLEYTAICHVNGCKMEHDQCRGSKKFPEAGQNLAMRGRFSSNPFSKETMDEALSKDKFQELVSNWYDQEIELDTFTSTIDKFAFKHETGHLTALLWAKTTHVGCAKAIEKPDDKKYTMHITCNYSPQGNVDDETIYIKGDPCTKCPAGTTCNDKFTSLCGKIDDTDIKAGPNPYRATDEKNSGHNFGKYSEGKVKVGLFVCALLIFLVSK